MTLAEIIAEAATIYSSDRSDIDQAKSISRLHQKLYLKLGRDSNQFTEATVTSVADQAEYDLPTGCTMYNIVDSKMQVETSEDSEKYEDFPFKSYDENLDYINYYTYSDDKTKFLIYENSLAIAAADRNINIKYYKENTSYDGSNLAVIPSLELKFHDYFVYGLVAENASCGEDPDYQIANFWEQKTDEFTQDIIYRITEDENNAATHSPGAKEFM